MPASGQPKVSVILNCYNHELYVRQALSSILNQTFSDFEVILIDNGSTDGTRSILEEFDDPRIRRMFFSINESLSKRLNQGVDTAQGEFVCVLYSDDYMVVDKLEYQVGLFSGLPDGYAVVYGPAIRLNQNTGAMWQCQSMGKSGDILPSMLRDFYKGAPDMSSPLIRRNCFSRARWHEDLFSDGEAIFFRIACEWKFHFDPKPTVVLRDHSANMGKAILRNHDMAIEVLNRLCDYPSFPKSNRPDLVKLEALMCRNHAWAALRMGSQDAAWVRKQLINVVFKSPRLAVHPRWVGAWVFVLVPWSLRVYMNWMANRILNTKENSNLVAHY